MSELHTIRNMLVEVRSDNYMRAAMFQQSLSYQLHTSAFSEKLEQLFDEIIPPGMYVEVPEITIEVTDTDEKLFESKMLQALSAAIKAHLQQAGVVSQDILSVEQYKEAAFIFFLCYGIRTPGAEASMPKSLVEQIRRLPVESQPWLERLILAAAERDKHVWARLFYWLKVEGMKLFFMRISNSTEAGFNGLLQQLCSKVSKPSLELRDHTTWQLLFQYFCNQEYPAGKGNGADSFTRDGGEPDFMIGGEPAFVVRTGRPDESQHLERILREGCPISNSGIILLWRECGQLLRRLGWVSGNAFTGKEAQQRAVLLLHYIAFGQTEALEDELVLNKLLFGWPLEEPVDPIFAPGEEEMKAADLAFEAYLATWKPGRKFSVPWFRRAFIIREGNLSRRPDGNWQLEIQDKAEDIIVDKVSLVKYSWMSHILFVKW